MPRSGDQGGATIRGSSAGRRGRSRETRALGLAAAGLLLLAILSTGPGRSPVVTAAATGAPALGQSAHNDTSPALASLSHTPPQAPQRPHEEREPQPLPRPVVSHPPTPRTSPRSSTRAPAPLVNFDGLGEGFRGPQGLFR